jgi:hypothetical protein
MFIEFCIWGGNCQQVSWRKETFDKHVPEQQEMSGRASIQSEVIRVLCLFVGCQFASVAFGVCRPLFALSMVTKWLQNYQEFVFLKSLIQTNKLAPKLQNKTADAHQWLLTNITANAH